MNKAILSFYIFTIGLLCSCSAEPPTKEYLTLAKHINDKAPYDFNRGMRLDGANAISKKKFKYSYTLLQDPNSSKGSFINKVKPQVINSLKRSAESKKFKEDNMTIVYSYSKEEGTLFAEFEITPSEY